MNKYTERRTPKTDALITTALNNVFPDRHGVVAVVDGQYGSTGKGVAAALLADWRVSSGTYDSGESFSNAGPNSGHTFYTNAGEKVVLRQLPTFAVAGCALKGHGHALLTDGAIIDINVLREEMQTLVTMNMCPSVTISPNAAIITDRDHELDSELKDRLGSTGKGTGAALAAKVMRYGDLAKDHVQELEDIYSGLLVAPTGPQRGILGHAALEVSQGFSLGINRGFYPFSTSRECTVMQGLADACIHPHHLQGTMMVVRAHPIRVGGNSGPGYLDQKELTWEELGVEPEVTTVTQKVRRVFSWSQMQFAEAIAANRPDVILVNFLNYIVDLGEDPDEFVRTNVYEPYRQMFGRDPIILGGFGPKTEDVRLWQP